MAAFTSKATGNWSASGQTTWNEVGVPGSGDTVSIGAHTITVDVNTTVGTSPNDTTTTAINLTAATSVLKVAAGVTLTVKGNRGAANGSTFQQEAGSTVTFDASASGGSPIYRDINGGFTKYVFNGTSANRCVIQAVTGHTYFLNGNWSLFTAAYTTFRRNSTPGAANSAGGSAISITNCLYDTCGKIDITHSSATINFTFNDNEDLAPQHATDSFQLSNAAAATSGVRTVSRNRMLKMFVSIAKTLYFDNNVFKGISCSATGGVTTFARPPRNNVFLGDGVANGGNGIVLNGSWDGLYVVIENGTGNPHFLSPCAETAVDEILSRVIFESQSPDLNDVGDCFIMNASTTSGGNKVIAKNSIVLKASLHDATAGCALTIYSTAVAPLFEAYRCTVNVNTSAVGAAGKRGAFAVAEANAGAAGQVTALKSNIAWGSTAGQGYLADRVTGNVKDIITPAGADYNWCYNTSAGDNQRSYEDKAAANTLWTAGDAVAAGVDVHQGSGDPQFVDSTRNMASWAAARGYGSTYADAKTALYADPRRGADLIDYVFEGFKVRNPAMRSAAHDGGCVGAANFHRTVDADVANLRTFFSSAYGVAA